jgi:hypothetical protein
MTQKIQIPLIHPQKISDNVTPELEFLQGSSIIDSKRESLLFPIPRKRHFDETQNSEDNYFKIKTSISSDTIKEKENHPFEENHNTIKDKEKMNKIKNTSLDYLENFFNLDEKFNDYDGFPHPNIFVRG